MWKTPKEIRKISFIIFGIGLLLCFFGYLSDGYTPLMVAGIITMFCACGFHLFCYNCPHCGKYLDRSTGEYCPYCSRKVNELR